MFRNNWCQQIFKIQKGFCTWQYGKEGEVQISTLDLKIQLGLNPFQIFPQVSHSQFLSSKVDKHRNVSMFDFPLNYLSPHLHVWWTGAACFLKVICSFFQQPTSSGFTPARKDHCILPHAWAKAQESCQSGVRMTCSSYSYRQGLF